jgi:uncharacterized protein YlzI (FlbEa/FlbD family)
MEQKFIRLNIQEGQYQYINPVFITSVLKVKDKCAVCTMDGRVVHPEESVEDVMKKIREVGRFTWEVTGPR